MKGMAGFVVAALLVALAGAACMGIARFERNMAAAEEDLVTLRYADAAEKLSSAAAYTEYTRWLPGEGGQAARDLRARQASAQYWQRGTRRSCRASRIRSGPSKARTSRCR